MLIVILDTLALVGFRGSLLANLCGKLTYGLLVCAADDNGVCTGALNGNAFRCVHDHLVRKAKVHCELVVLYLYSVTNTVDFQILLEALGHAQNHVVNEGAGQAVKRLVRLLIVGSFYNNFVAFYCDCHVRMNIPGKFPLGALYGNSRSVNLYVNAGRNFNRL